MTDAIGKSESQLSSVDGLGRLGRRRHAGCGRNANSAEFSLHTAQ
jgi:hypothetical protein